MKNRNKMKMGLGLSILLIALPCFSQGDPDWLPKALTGTGVFVFPKRTFPEGTVDLGPLFRWWYTVQKAPHRERPELINSRPLAAWKVVTGPIVERRPSWWVIDAIVFSTPWSNTISWSRASKTPIRVVLLHPPDDGRERGLYASYTELHRYVASADQYDEILYKMMDTLRVPSYDSGHAYAPTPETIHAPLPDYARSIQLNGAVHCFALETGKVQAGLTVFDCGFHLP